MITGKEKVAYPHGIEESIWVFDVVKEESAVDHTGNRLADSGQVAVDHTLGGRGDRRGRVGGDGLQLLVRDQLRVIEKRILRGAQGGFIAMAVRGSAEKE